jgi:hypothetical protein
MFFQSHTPKETATDPTATNTSTTAIASIVSVSNHNPSMGSTAEDSSFKPKPH